MDSGIQVGPTRQDKISDYLSNWRFVWKYTALLFFVFALGVLLAVPFSPVPPRCTNKCCKWTCELLNCTLCKYNTTKSF